MAPFWDLTNPKRKLLRLTLDVVVGLCQLIGQSGAGIDSSLDLSVLIVVDKRSGTSLNLSLGLGDGSLNLSAERRVKLSEVVVERVSTGLRVVCAVTSEPDVLDALDVVPEVSEGVVAERQQRSSVHQ